jgi:hypothetical protein
VKTTVELPDALLREAKAYALQRGVPLREVFESALVRMLRETPAAAGGFRLKTITTRGEGLQIDGEWSQIRSLIYEGRGG